MRIIFYFFLLAIVVTRVVSFNHGYPEGQFIRVNGRVLNDPIVYETKRFVKINRLGSYIDLFPEVGYGDRVVMEGVVAGNKLQKAKLISVGQGGGLFSIRRNIVQFFERSLPEPHASLLAGIVLGSKANMPADFWGSLKTTGTAHVVVASGMNVTFVISFLLNSLTHLIKRQKAILVAMLGAWVYVILSGFDAPLVRAAVMGSIAFSAQALGRLSTALSALLLSAAFMLIIKPEWAHDLGFILSFIATLSLILFETKISIMLSRVPFLFKKDLATTVAAQIGVTPILLFSFGSFNILSPLINAVILWTVPPIMIIGGVAAVVGLVIPPIGQILVYLAYPFTWWFTTVVALTSSN